MRAARMVLHDDEPGRAEGGVAGRVALEHGDQRVIEAPVQGVHHLLGHGTACTQDKQYTTDGTREDPSAYRSS